MERYERLRKILPMIREAAAFESPDEGCVIAPCEQCAGLYARKAMAQQLLASLAATEPAKEEKHA